MENKDNIFINKLKLSTIIGILEHELNAPQEVIANINIESNLQAAGKSDNLADSIDYAAVAEMVTSYAENNRHGLLEHLAENIVNIIKERFTFDAIRVELHKPAAVKNAKSVGVAITRYAKSTN